MFEFSVVWQSIEALHFHIYAFAFTLAASLVVWIFRPRVNLIFGHANNSRNVVKLETGDVEIFVEKFYLQNTGRKAATSVDFVLSKSPNDISIWQPRDYRISTLPNGEFLINIPFISPGELVIVDCLYLNNVAAFVASVKCLEDQGQEIRFQTVRQFGKLLNYSLIFLIFLGIVFLIQLVLTIFFV